LMPVVKLFYSTVQGEGGALRLRTATLEEHFA